MRALKQFLCGLFLHGWVRDEKPTFGRMGIRWIDTGFRHCMFCGKVDHS